MSADLRHFPNGELPGSVQEAYAAVLQIANEVLRVCKFFSLEVLQLENPSITQIAHGLHLICDIMESLAKMDLDGDTHTPTKAREYAVHIRCIAAAVDDGDENELQRQISSLNQRSFL